MAYSREDIELREEIFSLYNEDKPKQNTNEEKFEKIK